MAGKPKVKIVSRIGAAKTAGDEAVALAIAHAIHEGGETTRTKIDQISNKRGYNLSSESVQTHVTPREGVIALDEWWWKFFEFGTVHLPAMPTLRPGHRKARKVLKEDLAADFEKWISRRARVPKR